MLDEDNCSLSKLKSSVSKNDGSSLRSKKFSNNFELPEVAEETSICEQSQDSHDVSTLKSDHNNEFRMNKKQDFLDRSTPSKSSSNGICIDCRIFVVINDCSVNSELNIWFCCS
jgi:hypothetical protein